MIVQQVSIVLRRTAVSGGDRRFDNLSGSHHQSQVTLMMTLARAVETSVDHTTSNSPSQDNTHPDIITLPFHVTPASKPFTAKVLNEIRAVLLLLMVNSSMYLYFIHHK